MWSCPRSSNGNLEYNPVPRASKTLNPIFGCNERAISLAYKNQVTGCFKLQRLNHGRILYLLAEMSSFLLWQRLAPKAQESRQNRAEL